MNQKFSRCWKSTLYTNKVYSKDQAQYTTNLLSPVSLSVVTAAVRPTPEEPRPVVVVARGAVLITYRSS